MITECLDVYMSKTEFEIFEEQYSEYITRSITEKGIDSSILINFHCNGEKTCLN